MRFNVKKAVCHTKLFGCVQFTVFVYKSIFPSKRDSTRIVNETDFLFRISFLGFAKSERQTVTLNYPLNYVPSFTQYSLLSSSFGVFWWKDPGGLISKRPGVQEDGMNFSYDVHVLLAKSEKLVGRRRWLSSYDKFILRTLAVVDVFFTRRNSPKLFLWIILIVLK